MPGKLSKPNSGPQRLIPNGWVICEETGSEKSNRIATSCIWSKKSSK